MHYQIWLDLYHSVATDAKCLHVHKLTIHNCFKKYSLNS